MAQMQKMESEVEVKCSGEKLFDMFAKKLQHIPNIISDKVHSIEPHQHDMGTTRTWNCVIDGKPEEIVAKMEAVDEEKKMIQWNIIDRGETMSTQYKTMATKIHAIPVKGGDYCLVKLTIEYERFNEDATYEPHQLLHFCLGMLKDVGSHLANNAY